VATTPTPLLALVGSSVGDPDGTRTITAIVALLVVLGLGLLMLGVWLFRTTRPDPELLAPLEVMGERRWRRGDPVWQRRRLDEVRPSEARPLQPSAAPPELDSSFDEPSPVTGFDDLHEDHLRREGADPDEDLRDGRAGAAGDEADHDGDIEGEIEADVDDADPTLFGGQASDADPAVVRLFSSSSATPSGIVRPTPDDLPDHEIDPDVMAAAIAELEVELARQRPDPGDAEHDGR
jgi:hypothetical protein